MAEPISSTAGATVGTGLDVSTFLGFVMSVDYSIVFGAFAGSVFFIVTANNLTRNPLQPAAPGYSGQFRWPEPRG